MTIEIVCCSVEDCKEATEGGAHRIELCGALEVGGLTPSIGLVEAAMEATHLPLMVMVRPRAGGFHYTPEEHDTMRRDIRALKKRGVAGVVFGTLTSDGEIDTQRLSELIAEADGMQVMHHRAFDVVPDCSVALEQLIAAGVHRVLTSGRKSTALEGAALLKQLHEQAAGRIEINPAGAIRPENAKEVAEATGIPRLHLAPFLSMEEASCRHNPELSFAGVSSAPDGWRTVTDMDAVQKIVQMFAS